MRMSWVGVPQQGRFLQISPPGAGVVGLGRGVGEVSSCPLRADPSLGLWAGITGRLPHAMRLRQDLVQNLDSRWGHQGVQGEASAVLS